MSACPVRGCAALVPASLLMCKPHWAMVPKRQQAAVHAAWRNFTKASRADQARALREHTILKREATAAVDAKARG